MDNAPLIMQGIITSQDPVNYGVNVALSGWGGGQGPNLPVRVMTQGPRDAVRGHFPELPMVGTVGLVAFPRGDSRNGVWLGSFGSTANDANPYQAGWQGLAYHAKHGGGYSWSGPDGTEAAVLADGSSFLAGTTMPQPVRYTVDGSQKRVATPYTAAERVPAPPGPFPMAITLTSGVSVSITAAGVGTFTFPGGVVITVNSGTVTIAATTVDINAGTVNLGGTGGRAVARVGDVTSNGGTIIATGVTTTKSFST